MSSTNKKVSIFALVAIFCVNLAYMADLVIVPAAGSIYAELSDAPISVLNFILSGPQLITIFSALIAPSIMKRFSKKKIIVTFFGIFTIAASICGFILNPYFIAAMRAIVGFCGGILMSTAMAFIAELFWDNEETCGAVMGYYNSSMNAFGVVLPLVAGVLCVRQWNLVFYEYLIGIPLLLLMIFCLPDIAPDRNTVSEEIAADHTDEKLPVTQIVCMLISVVSLGVIFNFATYESALYLAENNLGDASVAGIISSVGSVTGVIAGLCFGKMYAALKNKMAILIYFLLMIGYIGISFVLNAAWFGVCLGVMGFAYGASMSYYFAYATTFVPESKSSTVIGWITSCVSVGTFLCTYAATLLQNILHIETLLGLCPVYAIFSAIGVAAVAIAGKVFSKN